MNTILSYLGYGCLALSAIILGSIIFIGQYLWTYRYGNWRLSFEDRVELIRQHFYE